MSRAPRTTPVADTVPKVDREVAVGEDLKFQRGWWIFERLIWSVFGVIIVCDVLGLFGQGWLATATARTPDGVLTLSYERIERASTPSTLTLRFGPGAVVGGRIQLFVSDSVVNGLGAQRISPEPAVSTLGGRGITYSFPATRPPAEVQIQLQPTMAGPHAFQVAVPGEPPVAASVFVMP